MLLRPRVVRLYACLSGHLSVILVHPAQAIGQNEMPSVRDTSVVPGNTV